VLNQAVALADANGLGALSMRTLAASLGVEAMSLYNHVADKDAMLGGMVELVMAHIYLPVASKNWLGELRLRYLSAHAVLVAHPWVASLLESRRGGPLQMQAHDAVLGCLFGAGFADHMVYRAVLTLDSYLYGFAFQEVTWPHARSDVPAVVREMQAELSAEALPHVAAIMRYVAQSFAGPSAPRGHLEYRAEFEFGLDLILNGLRQNLEARL
jgi:AcrR family transcriptional regulator